MTTQPMRHLVLVGATSAMAEHCARLWAAQGPARFSLIGRDARRLQAIAADLQVRSPGSTCHIEQPDFLDPAAIQSCVTTLAARAPIDIALVAHGHLPDQAACETDLALCRDELALNGLSPVLFAEALAGAMQRAGRGCLGLIGSVAGDRGRRSNYVYGAAKGLLERYAEGLQHRLAATPVRVVLIKPGPTATPMTAQLQQAGARLATVDVVAGQIVAALAAGRAVAYTPGRWRVIMTVIRLLPRAVFHRLNI